MHTNSHRSQSFLLELQAARFVFRRTGWDPLFGQGRANGAWLPALVHTGIICVATKNLTVSEEYSGKLFPVLQVGTPSKYPPR